MIRLRIPGSFGARVVGADPIVSVRAFMMSSITFSDTNPFGILFLDEYGGSGTLEK
jgi:hypothetical protein